MIVVCGIRRSGTSALMGCLCNTFGYDQLCGDVIGTINRRYGEAEVDYLTRRMLTNFVRGPTKYPTYESPFVYKGVREQIPDKNLIKLMPLGLLSSNLDYIDMVLFIKRNPVQHLRSMMSYQALDDAPIEIFKKVLKNEWMLMYKCLEKIKSIKPYCVITYEQLISGKTDFVDKIINTKLVTTSINPSTIRLSPPLGYMSHINEAFRSFS